MQQPLAFFLLLVFISSVGENVKVAAALNLLFVMEGIKTEFEKQYPITCNVIYDSSGNLVSQIVKGMHYNAFLFTDMQYQESLTLCCADHRNRRTRLNESRSNEY